MKYPFLDLAAINRRYSEQLIAGARRVIESGQYIAGQEVKHFNLKLGNLCKAPYAIGVSNGLDALRLILEALIIAGRLRKGDGVIVAANTYIASLLAITHAGLQPILVDPDPTTMNLSATGIKQGVAMGAKAVMPVHLYGRVAWNDAMRQMVEDAALIVVEDAAQSIGAKACCEGIYHSDMAGALGHGGAFSFYPTKNIGALGDAGAVVTHDEEIAQIVKALANYGSDHRYHNIYQGFNCRLDPMQAAMLSIKIDGIDNENRRRTINAETYRQNIANPLIVKPFQPQESHEMVWHQYVVRIEKGMRQQFIEYLSLNGVGTDIHYPTPPHRQACYQGLEHIALPITEQLATEVVSLPIAGHLEKETIMEISEIINRFKP